MKLEFSQQIFEKTYMSSLIKIRQVGAELFHAEDRKPDWRTDGQTDMAKRIVAFRDFANAP
jgi:hypothetical protein